MTGHTERGSGELDDEGRCPGCGSTHVAFHVVRAGMLNRPLPERSLVWECRDCHVRWTERLIGYRNPDHRSPDHRSLADLGLDRRLETPFW